MTVMIKGRLIDAKKPLICVPVTDTDRESIIDHISSLCASGVEMIEWRLDFYSDHHDPQAVRSLLDELAPITGDVIFVVTLRSRDQGGECALDETERKSLLIAVACAHVADLIDVEYFSYENPDRFMGRLREHGALIILSHHDFVHTPKEKVLLTLLEQMADCDPDIAKLAVMPLDMSDVLTLLSVTEDFYKKNPTLPIITMSMGPMGMISRVGGFLFGSCVTFASDGEAVSAPGQLPREQVAEVIDILSVSISK